MTDECRAACPGLLLSKLDNGHAKVKGLKKYKNKKRRLTHNIIKEVREEYHRDAAENEEARDDGFDRGVC